MVSDGKESLKQDLSIRFNRMLNGLLSSTELICKNDYQYNATRKKFLRIVNDTLRDLYTDLDKRYDVQAKSERKDEYNLQ